MTKHKPFDIEIDKFTRSIENALTGESFKTEVLQLTSKDINSLKKSVWLFDWEGEAKQIEKTIYKLIIVDNPTLIQGLISIENRGDHIFISLIENNIFNKGADKIYLGVPGNLIAFVCRLSFERGYEGYVSFESKTKLIEYYKKSLGANVLFGNIMAIDTITAQKLVDQYFPKKL